MSEKQEIMKEVFNELDIDVDDVNFEKYQRAAPKEAYERLMIKKSLEYVPGGRKYQNSQRKVDLRCVECDFEFETKPAYKTTLECPACRKIRKERERLRAKWKRVKDIVEDKYGKIKQIDKETGKIVVTCGQGHEFITTPKKVISDNWCPTCNLRGANRPYSGKVIKPGQKNKMMLKKLDRLASLKHCTLVSRTYSNARDYYTFKCNVCMTTFQKTPGSLGKSAAPCPSHCATSPEFRLNDIVLEGLQ